MNECVDHNGMLLVRIY